MQRAGARNRWKILVESGERDLANSSLPLCAEAEGVRSTSNFISVLIERECSFSV